MNIKQIKQLFFDSSPDLPWKSINNTWRIKEKVVSDRKILGEYSLLWTKDGRRGDTGKSIKLSNLRKDFHHIGQDWRKKVLELAAEFEEQKVPIQIVALSVGTLIVDGCHRVSSIMMCECQFSILIVELDPPKGIVWTVNEML